MEFKYWKDKAAAEGKTEISADYAATQLNNNVSEQAENIEYEYAAMRALEEQLKNETAQVIEGQQVSVEKDSNIVDLDHVRKVKEEENAKEQREIDEFFEQKEKKQNTGKIFKYIFVDGLLGIPVLTIFDLLTGCFIALFAAAAILILGLSLATMAAALFMIAAGVNNVMGTPVSGIYFFGASFLTAAVSLILLLIATFFAFKLIPFVAKLAGLFEKKLNLFGKRA